MMHTYRLPDHLGACEVDGHMLMLDLRRDRYLQLDPYTAAALRRWRDQPEVSSREAGLTPLVERGMLIPAEPFRGPSRALRPVPDRSLLDRAPRVPRRAWAVVPEIAATLWVTRGRLRRSGLECAVREVRRRTPAATATDPAGHVALFRTARRLLPAAPNCLIDSLALSAFLARRSIHSELVFGVKLDPFAAHCWLQNDDAILNDAADSVTTFTPIMVI